MNIDVNPHKDPLLSLAVADCDGVLAVIIGVEGPSYRPLGARMAVFPNATSIGTLSSGCIEADIALHAKSALADNTPMRLRYGLGSPFLDIQLPCGGGLEILLIPRPDLNVLGQYASRHTARRATSLSVEMSTGRLALTDVGATQVVGDTLQISIPPEPFFYVFGKGPEAATFAALVQSAGFPNILLSPDEETLAIGNAAGCAVQHLTTPNIPQSIKPDPWSAVVLFFHDHDWEPPILRAALDHPAFYIGAQGSVNARDARLAELRDMGVPPQSLTRLRGPIGLIPSARDARTLAVSVLAEVLAEV